MLLALVLGAGSASGALLSSARLQLQPESRATTPRAGCLFGTNDTTLIDIDGLLRQPLRLPDTLEGLRGALESIAGFPSGLQSRVTSCSNSVTSCSNW